MLVHRLIPKSLVFSVLFTSSIPVILGQQISHSPWKWDFWKRLFVKRGDLFARDGTKVSYYSPLDRGGNILARVPVTYPPGQGEPLNAIISGLSDDAVLKDQEEDGGLKNYFLSFGFSGECLGQHAGDSQAADLGDGNGYKNETAVIRWNYGDAQLGTCRETIQGGNHFRYWVQNGPSAHSGAIFMATSYEMSLNMHHDIIVNGYNLGRDWLIGNITASPIPTQNLTNSSTYTGTTAWAGYTYQSHIKYTAGLIENTNYGINHNWSVSANGVNASDGLVAVIEVKLTGKPPSRKSYAWQTSPVFWELLVVFPIITLAISL